MHQDLSDSEASNGFVAQESESNASSFDSDDAAQGSQEGVEGSVDQSKCLKLNMQTFELNLFLLTYFYAGSAVGSAVGGAFVTLWLSTLLPLHPSAYHLWLL